MAFSVSTALLTFGAQESKGRSLTIKRPPHYVEAQAMERAWEGPVANHHLIIILPVISIQAPGRRERSLQITLLGLQKIQSSYPRL
jgi:hypothetical protein